jgi:hypothetical protein
MSDNDPRSRFSGIKEEYSSGSTSSDGNTRPESNTSNDDNDNNASKDALSSSDSTAGSEGLKARRKSVQAYVPPSEKENLEQSWRRVKALCNLADTDEPPKNDFYTAALREGYSNFEEMVKCLGLSEPYREYGDLIRG